MPKFEFAKGEEDIILPVYIQDSSAQDGSGLAGLDEGSSITGFYVQRNGLGIALTVNQNVTTEGTYQAPSTVGQVRIGTPANAPDGFYELHFHNDLFAGAGKDWVTIGLTGASNMATLAIEVQLVANDPNVSGVDVTKIGGDAQSATDLKDFTDTGYDPVAHEVLLVNTTTTNTDMVGTNSANTTTPPTVEEIADQVWDEPISGHVGGSSFGAKNQKVVPSETVGDYKADVSGLSTHDAAAVWTAGSRSLSTPNDYKADVSGLSTHDAAAAADAVWDEAISEHVAGASFGAKNQKVVPSETLSDYKATGFSTHDASDIIPKKNTAFTFDFPMVDETNHNLQAGLSVSGVVIIDGAATAALDGSIAPVSDGIYRCSASAVDMNGDSITFLFTATGADPSPAFIFKTAA